MNVIEREKRCKGCGMRLKSWTQYHPQEHCEMYKKYKAKKCLERLG